MVLIICISFHFRGERDIFPGAGGGGVFFFFSRSGTQMPKDDFQSVLCTLKSLFTNFVLFHVRHHKM